MSKSILIGNGFTSQLIPEYSDSYMKEKLLQYCKKDYLYINELFNIFRITENSYKDVYNLDDNSLINPKIKESIINVLNENGFETSTFTFDTYFILYGLIYEVIEKEIISIENLLKAIDLFSKIGRIDKGKKTEIIRIANIIYYNEGKYGLKDTNLMNFSKIKDFLNDFIFIFTTNYDLIIDDICENKDKVFHLHGGFNIRKVIDPKKVYYIKTNERLTDTQAHIIWGVNSEEKRKNMEGGITFPITFPIQFPEDMFHRYFDKIEEENIQEMHIFGFSGRNDQHINKRISNNKNLRRIYFYCDPKNISNDNDNCKIKELFKDTKAEIVFEPWDKIWSLIR